jgi:hypothetical protein
MCLTFSRACPRTSNKPPTLTFIDAMLVNLRSGIRLERQVRYGEQASERMNQAINHVISLFIKAMPKSRLNMQVMSAPWSLYAAARVSSLR